MTALAANDTNLKRKNRGQLSMIVTNSATVYVGGGVGVTTAGRASPWADTAGMEWLGLALPSSKRNLPANAGGKVVGDTSYSPPHEVEIDCSGQVLLAVPVAGASAQANVGDRVYCATDNLSTDLSLTPTTNVKAIGVIERYISATSFNVRLFTPQEYKNQALQADLTALTDSTGYSGTHDDTLAATTVPTATATNPAAPTAYAAVVNMTDPVTKAEGEAVSAALATLRGEVATYETAISALVVDVAAILALLAVMTQNQSDAGQKINEICVALNLGN